MPMTKHRVELLSVVAVGLAAVVGAFLIGRGTAAHPAARPSSIGGYVAGLRDGAAQGREVGRALQLGAELPAGDRHLARDAFRAGYTAGANDVFAGYDGGWTYRAPWLVVLSPGSGAIEYRIRDRTPLEPGISYFLCPGGHAVCHEPR
jgi:hypothetical protein